MKQVWIFNHYAQEPGGAGGTRHFHLAEHLKKCGWVATVVASSVELNSGRQRLLKNEKNRLESISDVNFLWVNTPEYVGNGGGRIRNMFSYSWQAFLKSTTQFLPRPDAIIGSSVHPFAAVAAAFVARRLRVPFIFEVRDLWPQTLVDMGRLKDRSLITWALRKLELWLYKRASKIVVLLPYAWQYIVPLGIDKKRIAWIPNGVDLTLFPSVEQNVDEANSQFTLMYFGAHGQANGLENILKAMKIVQERDVSARILLRMIGDGPLKPSLMSLAVELQLRNVKFEDAVAKREIPGLAKQADAFVFNLIDAPVFRYGVSSNKLFDFLASARPVIFCCNSANNPVNEAGAGVTVQAGEPKELADAIFSTSLLSAEERFRMGRMGREYVETNHGFSHLAERLATTLNESLISDKRGGL